MNNTHFSQKLLKYQPSLNGLAIRYTKNEETAKDLVQDTLMSALKNESRFQINSNLWAWLKTIMRNLFINNYRKRIRRKTEPVDWQSLSHLSRETVENLGLTNLELNEIETTIDQMDAKYQTALYMLAEGYSYKEIASEVNAPLGTIKSRIFHGRKVLEKYNR